MAIHKVLARDDGYLLQMVRKEKWLTNFIIVPTASSVEGEPRRYNLVQKGRVLATIDIPREAWASRSKFLTLLHGISNLAYFGRGGEDLRLIEELVHAS